MKKSILFSLAIAAVSLFGSCANDVEMNYPSTHKLIQPSCSGRCPRWCEGSSLLECI